MRAHSKQLFAAAVGIFLVFSPAAVEAQRFFSLGRSLSELSSADREAMMRARIEVLDKLQPGSVAAWTDKSTGHSGEVNLRRIYEKNGMTCGDVEHILKKPEIWRFSAAFCRGGDGTWRTGG